MPFAWILGKILEAIYFIFSSIGIESIGLCIIVFTVEIFKIEFSNESGNSGNSEKI